MPQAFADLSTPILVVDDHPDITRLVSHALLSMGFTDIMQASDGSTALGCAQKRSFGLIISDIQMQPQNGLDLIEHLKEDETAATPSDVPFIVLTGYTEASLMVVVKEAGIEQILHKPFKKDDLKACVEACLGPLPQE